MNPLRDALSRPDVIGNFARMICDTPKADAQSVLLLLVTNGFEPVAENFRAVWEAMHGERLVMPRLTPPGHSMRLEVLGDPRDNQRK